MNSTADIARNYIDAVGAHDLDALDQLFSDDLVATVRDATFDKPAWIAALKNLLPALIRNDIRTLVADGSKACVIYDFVTDTDAGAVACVESLTVEHDRIMTVELIFDRVSFAPVGEALAARASAKS